MDLTPLRPVADTTTATLEALNRCIVAGKGCLAMIDRLKQERLGLLMHGHPDQLRRNASDLANAMADGAEIGELTEHLQTMLKDQAPEQVAEIAIQQRAIEAAASMADWWSTNSPLVIEGLQKMGVAFVALGELQAAVARTNAAAEVARNAATNVATFPSRPVA